MALKPLYLDEAATSRVDTSVFAAMKPYFTNEYGNPSSLHAMGERAAHAIKRARAALAKELRAKPQELYFTSGGTESSNWAIQGSARANPKKNKIIISAIEHAAVKETCTWMKTQGYNIVEISVDTAGMVDVNELARAIDTKTLLVSIIHGNNIIGTIQDLKTIGAICKKKNVLFHVDATQTFGNTLIDVNSMNIDLLSTSAHKLGGPKGIGLLYIREGTRIQPLLFGGGQEKNMRSGTENVPGIVGFAKALEVSKKTKIEQIRKIRDRLCDKLTAIGATAHSSAHGLASILTVIFQGIDNETMVYRLSHKGIYVSAGSACDSKKQTEDHVLKAIGLRKKEIASSIRISISSTIKERDITRIVNEISAAYKKLRR